MIPILTPISISISMVLGVDIVSCGPVLPGIIKSSYWNSPKTKSTCSEILSLCNPGYFMTGVNQLLHTLYSYPILILILAGYASTHPFGQNNVDTETIYIQCQKTSKVRVAGFWNSMYPYSNSYWPSYISRFTYFPPYPYSYGPSYRPYSYFSPYPYSYSYCLSFRLYPYFRSYPHSLSSGRKTGWFDNWSVSPSSNRVG